MRFWPFYRSRRTPKDRELDAAHWEVDRAITDAKCLRGRADDVVDKLSKTRERNHFAAAVAQRFRGA